MVGTAFGSGATLRGVAPILLAVSAFTASAETVLFPTPLHLVRRVEDPLAASSITVDEYCAGNRVVTIYGERVSITDYDKQQLTEIDRAAGTYSVTRFDEIAKHGRAERVAAAKAAPRDRWKTTQLGLRDGGSGRTLDTFEFVAEKQKIAVGIDRRVPLSREAVEVLIGAAYPHVRSEEHELLLRAAANDAAGAGGGAAVDRNYSLPADHVTTYDEAGTVLTFRASILKVDSDLPPPEALAIGVGTRRVESRLTRLAKELELLDRGAQPVGPPR